MKFVIKLIIALLVLDFLLRTVYDLGIEQGQKQCILVQQEINK